MKRLINISGKLKDTKGSAIVIAYFVIVVLLGIGASFLLLATNESRMSERQRLTTTAFHIAEAGIERGLYDLRMDFINATGSPSWSDGDINGFSIGPDTTDYYTIPYESTSLNGGSYTVELKNVFVSGDNVWVRSTGTIGGVSHTIRVYVRMVSLSPWDYAIFAGSGASGSMVNGNVDIRGSVLILGNGLEDGDYAIDMGGTAEIVMNNYSTLNATLKAKVPALPTVVFNGETVETLTSVLRVKKGIVGVSGNAEVGQADIPGNSVKETVDGVYTNDGFGGNQGTNNVFSDNGTSTAYDLGDSVVFPSLSDPYPGYASYQAYLKSIAYVPTAEEAATLANLTPSSNFSYGNVNKGSISMDGNGNLTVSGIIYIDNGGNLKMSGKDGILYTGKGSILVTGNAEIATNLLTPGNNSFPTNILGIMTPNNISFTTAQLDVMGVFYAENSIIAQKQTDILGTFVSNYFDMGTNVPAIYQVPQVSNNLPPGMIAQNSRWYMVVGWIKS